ncbi:hypothetical protein OG937_10870 [Streptomyces sp. NBC_00510]
MNLTITTVDGADGARRDHLVGLPPRTTVADLAEAVDGTRTRNLYLDGRRLDPDAPVASTGLREGGVLGLGTAGTDPDRVRADAGPVLAEVHVVSGPQAGRTWLLAFGSHEIGSGPLCAIRLEGHGVPEGGLWVTVGADGSAHWHRTRTAPGDEVRGRVAAPPPDGAVTALRRTRPQRVTTERTAAPGQPVPWSPGEDLTVGSVLLRMSAPVEADAAVSRSADGFGIDYNRPPRIAPHLDGERVRLPSPPAAPGKRPFPTAMMMLTSLRTE